MRLVLFLLLAAIAHAASITGKVVGVHDGDTITVLVETAGKKESVRVRLWGIDAPESKQAFGQAAKERLSQLTFGKTVAVDVKDKDRYGRTVGEVVADGVPVNYEMVRLGLAWWYEQFAPKAQALAQAQRKAREAKQGLWADAGAVPPWEFRRNEASKKTSGKAH